MKKRFCFSGTSGHRMYHTSGEAVLIGGNLSGGCCSTARVRFTGGQPVKIAQNPEKAGLAGDPDEIRS